MHPNRLTIGRNPDNDLVLQHPMVSNHHAILHKTLRGLLLEDVGSSNGTFHNHQRLTPKTPTPIQLGDVIMFANQVALDWKHPILIQWINLPYEELLPQKSPFQSRSVFTFDIVQGKKTHYTIGRDNTNDIVITHPRVSRKHAEVFQSEGQWVLRDLQSTNGTFVDGKRITESVITPQNQIVLAGNLVQLFAVKEAPQLLEQERIKSGRATIEVKNLSLTVTNQGHSKTLLQDITLAVGPSEFVGLIGPSGAGKTTLMLAINGELQPSEGNVYINGINLHKNLEIFKGLLGYVPQDDIIHRELTVEGSLNYAIRLRYPDLNSDERKQLLEKTLKELDLTASRNVPIGTPEKKGISGGQRKRVNLAQELVADPLVMFLDEPCSGLDPKSDADVMKLLRKLADSGITVVLTTHNITEKNFRYLDKIIVMAEGGMLAYYGPANQVCNYFEVSEPEQIFEKLKTQKSSYWKEKYKTSTFFQTYVHQPLQQWSQYKQTPSGVVAPTPKKTDDSKQVEVLIERNFEVKFRDTLLTAILLFQAPIIGLLIALVFSGVEASPTKPFPMVTPLFLLVISAIWFGASNAARELVGERAIYQRERKVFLTVGTYLFSKVFTLSILNLIQCILLLAITYGSCDLSGNWLGLLGVLFLVSLCGTALGLLISAISSTVAAAMAFIPIMLIPQVVLGGLMVTLNEMNGLVKVLAAAMPSRWGFEAVMAIADRAVEPIQTAQATSSLTETFGLKSGNLWLDIGALVIWLVVYLEITLKLLKKK
ncbi:MAG: FHA domain-containing protein [bacterium]|nr:FHA domain-containing protein [bacterium]